MLDYYSTDKARAGQPDMVRYYEEASSVAADEAEVEAIVTDLLAIHEAGRRLVQSSFLEGLDMGEQTDGHEYRRATEYLMWQLAGPLLLLQERVGPAVERYREKYGAEPNVVLASERDAGEVTQVCGLPLRTRSHIRPGIVWIGRE